MSQLISTQLISTQGLSVFKDSQTILENISLKISTGDFITIVGPNGAGKSILLQCLMGFYQPDQGQIERKAGLKFGYMPQNLSVAHIMPINTRRFLKLKKKFDSAAFDMAFDMIVAEMSIGHILETPLAQLSKGELQRVLLARALLREPELLVLDEPAQNLDISGQLAFYKLLKQVYDQRKISILMVSHDLHLVMSSTSHVICLFHHICCSGKPQEVARDPAFLSLFGEDWERMLTIYQHAHDHHHQGDS